MKYLKLYFIVVIISGLVSSCAPSVEVTSLSENRNPKPDDYKMLIFYPDDKLSDKFVNIAEISVYDGGLAIKCGFNAVLSRAVTQAKEIGADAIKITEINKPDFFSSCYRIKALALAYKDSDTATVAYEELSAPPDSLDKNFISFEDCYSCKDIGDINSFSRSNTKINLLSFFAFTVYRDGAHEIVRYPITESRIIPHFKMLLESYDWEVNYI